MQDNDKPLVAVTGPHKRLRLGWWATRLMLWLCGMRGVYLTANHRELPASIDGIVIGGGDDIEPDHYGEKGDPGRVYDPARDRLEMAMIEKALAAGIPMLGICRGAQLINVVFKGSLYADIRPLRKTTTNRMHVTPIKWVHLTAGTQLRDYLGVDRIKVNSLHNQAIDRVGRGLRVAGRDGDDFVQVVEGEESFVLGVQWHPEYLPYRRRHRQIFQLFAAAVSRSRRQLMPGDSSC